MTRNRTRKPTPQALAMPTDVVPAPVWADTTDDQTYVERAHDQGTYDRADQRADAIADQW